MKSLILMIGGVCAATAGFLVWGAIRTKGLTSNDPSAPVDLLAHRLEEAWADHHTVA